VKYPARGAAIGGKGITLDITDLDRVRTHLLRTNRAVVADALALPFPDGVSIW